LHAGVANETCNDMIRTTVTATVESDPADLLAVAIPDPWCTVWSNPGTTTAHKPSRGQTTERLRSAAWCDGRAFRHTERETTP